MKRLLVFFLVIPWLVSGASAQRPDRITVPLTDPKRPATVRVGLLSGGITVTTGNGPEIVVEPRPRNGDGDPSEADERRSAERKHERHVDEERDARARGLRRIANLGSGLNIEEEDNVVDITAPMAQSVDLVIQVPTGTTLSLNTVNDGDIVVRDFRGEVSIENTNGSIELSGFEGAAVVHALNGEIVARFAKLDAKKASSFSSMNGNIDVTLPAEARAEVRIKSDNGEIYTDFDLQMSARAEEGEDSAKPGKKRARRRYGYETAMAGTLGGGGPTLRFQTFNGNIYIRKAR